MELVCLHINNMDYHVAVEKNWTLLHVLREELGLTAVKCGCNTGDCGACKVIIDGEAVNSCLVLARNAVGKNIETVEGLSDGIHLHLSTWGQSSAVTVPLAWSCQPRRCWIKIRIQQRRRSGLVFPIICAAVPAM